MTDNQIIAGAQRQAELEAAKEKLTADQVRQLLDYNPETGVFTWRVSASNRAPVGSIAGNVHPRGYRYIRLYGRRNAAHRLAVLWMTGAMPTGDVDHANGIRDDNRWKNLRQASRSENLQNTSMHRDNRSGLMGVSKSRSGGWCSKIMKDGHSKYLGTFPTAEEAHAAYLSAKSGLHKFQPTPRQASTCQHGEI